jgi:hypothetical protein
MNKHYWYRIYFVFLILSIAEITGCIPSISVYSQYAYQQAVDLKVESLDLLSHADQSYKDYQKPVDELIQRIDKAYEYAKGRKDNDLSTKQWEILKDPDGNLMGSILKKWKSQDKLSSTYLTEKIKQISDAYDEIITLESGKQK